MLIGEFATGPATQIDDPFVYVVTGSGLSRWADDVDMLRAVCFAACGLALHGVNRVQMDDDMHTKLVDALRKYGTESLELANSTIVTLATLHAGSRVDHPDLARLVMEAVNRWNDIGLFKSWGAVWSLVNSLAVPGATAAPWPFSTATASASSWPSASTRSCAR